MACTYLLGQLGEAVSRIFPDIYNLEDFAYRGTVGGGGTHHNALRDSDDDLYAAMQGANARLAGATTAKATVRVLPRNAAGDSSDSSSSSDSSDSDGGDSDDSNGYRALKKKLKKDKKARKAGTAAANGLSYDVMTGLPSAGVMMEV